MIFQVYVIPIVNIYIFILSLIDDFGIEILGCFDLAVGPPAGFPDVAMPSPAVSKPRERGVTSTNKKSCTFSLPSPLSVTCLLWFMTRGLKGCYVVAW